MIIPRLESGRFVQLPSLSDAPKSWLMGAYLIYRKTVSSGEGVVFMDRTRLPECVLHVPQGLPINGLTPSGYFAVIVKPAEPSQGQSLQREPQSWPSIIKE